MVRELAEKYMGLDPIHEPIPVRPGQHYMMGGVSTNSTGETSLPGLYAVGETACVSINGANRLGSNSLSECLVFGEWCGLAAAQHAKQRVAYPRGTAAREALRKEETRIFDGLMGRERGKETLAGVRVEMQQLMERDVGIFRDEAGLSDACGKLAKLRDRFGSVGLADKDRVFNTEMTGVLELDGLNYIKDYIDATLTYRWSCRMGICGSCGANVNGTPRLTCGTYIRDVRKGTVTVDPLANFPILKDLVVDFDDFLTKLASVTPYIVREESGDLSKEFLQYPEDVEAYRQQSLCINCMLCYAACPVFGGSPEFVGPAASALALRYIRDTRDEGADERLARLNTKSGVWECTFVGECSVVCPKNVDPAAAIQSLKVLATTRHMRRLLMPGAASR